MSMEDHGPFFRTHRSSLCREPASSSYEPSIEVSQPDELLDAISAEAPYGPSQIFRVDSSLQYDVKVFVCP